MKIVDTVRLFTIQMYPVSSPPVDIKASSKPSEAIAITAQFDSICKVCHLQVDAGETVYWVPKAPSVTHRRCMI